MKGNGHPATRSTAVLEAMVAAGDRDGAMREIVRLLETLAADVRLAMLRINVGVDERAGLQTEIDDLRRMLWPYDPDPEEDDPDAVTDGPDDDDGRRATLDGSEVNP